MIADDHDAETAAEKHIETLHEPHAAAPPPTEQEKILENEAEVAESMEAPQMSAPPPPLEAGTPLDPLGIGKASLEVWQAMLSKPEAILGA